MTKIDRERRRIFLTVFPLLYFWPSDNMTVRCWRAAREALTDAEIDRLINGMVAVHNSRAKRLQNGGPDARRDRLQQE